MQEWGRPKLIEGHGSRYRLLESCVMPNHVHVVVKMNGDVALSQIIKAWKGVSAIEINRLLGRTGQLWQKEYHDRYVRDLDHFYDCRAYIRNNPVKARLCERPEEWKISSAGMEWTPD